MLLAMRSFARGHSLLLFLGLALCGCSVGTEEARKASDRFHEQLGSADALVMYQEFDQDLRKQMSSDAWLKLVAGVRTKLGSCLYKGPTSYFVNFNTAGTMVNLTYDAECTGGKASERLIWRKSGERMRLVGYFVNGPEFLSQ